MFIRITNGFRFSELECYPIHQWSVFLQCLKMLNEVNKMTNCMHYLVLNGKLFSEVLKKQKLLNRQATIIDTPVSQSKTTYSMPPLWQTPCWEWNIHWSSGDKIHPSNWYSWGQGEIDNIHIFFKYFLMWTISKFSDWICYNIASDLFLCFLVMRHGILTAQPGIKPILPALKGKALATGPLGKSSHVWHT